MIKNITKVGILALSLSALVACKENKKTANPSDSAKETESSKGLKVAIINIDSMQSSLDFFSSKSQEFAKEESAIQNELVGMQKSLQGTAANLSKRIQNKDISDVEIQNIQKRMENTQISIQRKGESLGAALMKKQMEFNNMLHAMLDAFTEEYNKEHGYDLILSNTSAVYSRPQMNITSDFTPKFNDWINKKLTDQAMMKTFQGMSEKSEAEPAK